MTTASNATEAILDYLNDASDPDEAPASYTADDLTDEIVERVSTAAGEAGDLELVAACRQWVEDCGEFSALVHAAERGDSKSVRKELDGLTRISLNSARFDHFGGIDALLDHLYAAGIAVNKYADPISGDADDIDRETADSVAREDSGLLYIDSDDADSVLATRITINGHTFEIPSVYYVDTVGFEQYALYRLDDNGEPTGHGVCCGEAENLDGEQEVCAWVTDPETGENVGNRCWWGDEAIEDAIAHAESLSR